jgi:hypothetical protein
MRKVQGGAEFAATSANFQRPCLARALAIMRQLSSGDLLLSHTSMTGIFDSTLHTNRNTEQWHSFPQVRPRFTKTITRLTEVVGPRVNISGFT